MEAKQLYLFCLIGITLFGGVFQLLLYKNFRDSKADGKNALFVAMALLSWTVVGVYKFADPPFPSLINAINDRILSAFSNLFLVISLPYFAGISEAREWRLYQYIRRENWITSVMIFFTAITVVFTIIDRSFTDDFSKKVIIAIDAVVSLASTLLFSIVLFKSLMIYWSETYLKALLISMLGLLAFTQIALPAIAIFPDQLRFAYYYCLGLMLFSLTAFIVFNAIYFNLYLNELRQAERIGPNTEKKTYLIRKLKVGYKEDLHYFIEINFAAKGDSHDTKTECVSTNKMYQPYLNWLVFALAGKLQMPLSHSDMALIKFRMIEYWNKDASTQINQIDIFSADMGNISLELAPANIEIDGLVKLMTKYAFSEALLKYEESFVASGMIQIEERSRFNRQEKIDRITHVLKQLNI
jgi:hypothetical protein